MEFENLAAGFSAIQDDHDFTVFLQNAKAPLIGEKCVLTIQVDSVEATHEQLSVRGVRFLDSPRKYFWGYGAELLDPDGCLIRPWDQVSMSEKGCRGPPGPTKRSLIHEPVKKSGAPSFEW